LPGKFSPPHYFCRPRISVTHFASPEVPLDAPVTVCSSPWNHYVCHRVGDGMDPSMDWIGLGGITVTPQFN